MAVDAPIRHRRETVREQNLRLELDALRHAAVAHCELLTPRLSWLYPAARQLSPAATQVVAECLMTVDRLRKRASP